MSVKILPFLFSFEIRRVNSCYLEMHIHAKILTVCLWFSTVFAFPPETPEISIPSYATLRWNRVSCVLCFALSLNWQRMIPVRLSRRSLTGFSSFWIRMVFILFSNCNRAKNPADAVTDEIIGKTRREQIRLEVFYVEVRQRVMFYSNGENCYFRMKAIYFWRIFLDQYVRKCIRTCFKRKIKNKKFRIAFVSIPRIFLLYYQRDLCITLSF